MDNLKTGVYKIVNEATEKVYVGSSVVSLLGRIRQHRRELKLGQHPNRHLQHAYDRYGEACFSYHVLEWCRSEECLEREQFWLDTLKAADPEHGYNLRPKAENNLGVKWSEESKAKCSATKTGTRMSQAAKENMRQAALSRWNDPVELSKHRQRMARLIPNRSEEVKRKRATAQMQAWADPQRKVKAVSGAKKSWRKLQSLFRRLALKAAWNDPFKRKMRLARLRKTRRAKRGQDV